VLSLFRGLIPTTPQPVFPQAIIREVASRRGVSEEDLLGRSRLKPFVEARQEAMWELRRRTGLSLPMIGHLLGDRDHTTVMWGIRRHADRLAAQQQERAA
jgi:chromosomal replication initiator protein